MHRWRHYTWSLIIVAFLGLALSPSAQSASQPSSFYDPCRSHSSLCFGMPDNCVDSASCQLLLRSDFDQNSGFHLQLLAPSISTDQYIAFAFSNQTGMSGLVVQCFQSSKSDRAGLQYSFNGYGKPHNTAIANLSEVTGFTNLKASYQNGQLLCEWSASPSAKINYKGIVFDVANDKFYLQLAMGPYKPEDNRIHYHGRTSRMSSSSEISLKSNSTVHPSGSSMVVRWHASLMIFGWIGCVTVAILMARFSRDLWPERKLFGLKYWFVVHRYLMLLGWLAIVASYIIIYVQYGWNKPSAHSVIGLVAGVLATLQIGNSFLRPAPDSKYRWIFDYGHWAVGNVAHILAVCNIINSGMKRSKTFLWLLIGYVFVYLTFSDLLRKLEHRLRQSYSSTKLALIFQSAVLGAVGVVVAIVVALMALMFING